MPLTMSDFYVFQTPPYWLFALSFFFASLAQAFQDTQANTFVSSISASHLWLGLIHAMYTLGLLIAPLVASSIAVNRPNKWAIYYAVPIGVGMLNIVLTTTAFFTLSDIWRIVSRRGNRRQAESTSQPSAIETATPEDERATRGIRTQGRLAQAKEEMKETLRVKSVWLLSLFFMLYLGASFTIGGWIVQYLSTVRNLPLSVAGYIPTAFSSGSFLGRLLLPHPTHTLLGGEHYMLSIYSIILVG